MNSESSPQSVRRVLSVLGAGFAVVGVALALLWDVALSPDPALSSLDGLVHAWVTWADGIRVGLGAWILQIRWPLLILLGGVYLWHGREGLGGPVLLVICVLVGLIAQSFVAERAVGWGILFYALAVLPILFHWKPLEGNEEEPSPGLEWGLVVLLLGIFSLLCLYRLDVYPPPYFDEVAYLRTAYMQLGTLPQTYIMPAPAHELYSFERFQSQLVPFYTQALALRVLDSGLFSLRLASWLANLAALMLAYLIFRRGLGVRVALWMLALSSASTLLVAYSRAGFYLSFCILGGVVAFWALTRLVEKWNVSSAFWMGLVAGASLYFYQLSWFIPPGLLLCLMLQPGLWRRPGLFRLGGVALGTFLLVVSPLWLLFSSGLEDVSNQTFDKKQPLWELPDVMFAAFIVPGGSLEEIDPDVVVIELPLGGDSFAVIQGSQDQVMDVVDTFDVPEITQLSGFVHRNPVISAVDIFFSKTFMEPGWESNGRINRRSILNPVLAPLVVLGFAVAWRKRANPVVWMLMVWVAFASFFPSLIAGMLPRRLLLGIPFVQVLMAGVLAEMMRSTPAQSHAVRWGLRALLVLFFVVALSESVHFYAQSWSQPGAYIKEWVEESLDSRPESGSAGSGGNAIAGKGFLERQYDEDTSPHWGEAALATDPILGLDKVTASIPEEQVIVLDDLWSAGVSRNLMSGERERAYVRFDPGPETISSVLAFACAQPLPFVWISGREPGRVFPLIMLSGVFEHSIEYQGGLRVMTLETRRSDDCERAGFPDPG